MSTTDFIVAPDVMIREGALNRPVSFVFAACSSAIANDGSIPFGTTIASAALVVKTVVGIDITTEVNARVISVTGGLTVATAFDYPLANRAGRCNVFVELTLSSGAVEVKLWDGLVIA